MAVTADEAIAALDAFTGADGVLLSIDDVEILASLVFARRDGRLTLDASFPGAERRSWFMWVRDQQDVTVEDVSPRRANRLIAMLARGDLSGLAVELGRPW